MDLINDALDYGLRVLAQELSNHAAVFFVVDAGEEFFAEFADCLRAVEG